ncbi:hypothetical protein NSS79_01225 [Paenibacillus sp. FSL L8-0436]|uniref:hypothetical protein n=1 Tax=Paenibacillus sp. FSL L8-0436 TaxID=2954686 RepID=UPI003158D6C4
MKDGSIGFRPYPRGRAAMAFYLMVSYRKTIDDLKTNVQELKERVRDLIQALKEKG